MPKHYMNGAVEQEMRWNGKWRSKEHNEGANNGVKEQEPH